MKKKRKILIILLILFLLGLLVKCGLKEKEETNKQDETQIVENFDNEDKDNNKKDEDKQETVNIEESDNKETETNDPIDDVKYYYVSFLDDDGKVLQKSKYKDGSMPAFKGTVENKIVGNYEYIFDSWTPNIHAVNKNQTYTATYTKTLISKPEPIVVVVKSSFKYLDYESGTNKTQEFDAGIVVTIDTSGGTISGSSSITTANDQVIDLTSSSYIPVLEDKIFMGYTYFDDTKKFVANYVTAGLYVNNVCYKELTVADCGENASLVKALITEDNTTALLPAGITSISNSAFSGCTRLSSIVLPDSVESIGNYSFENCTNLTSVNFPEGLTSIGENAFSNCPGLTSLSLPSTLSWFDDKAFVGCTGLESVSVASGNALYDSRNNCNAIMQKSTDYLLFGCKNTVMPSETKAINRYAFYYCTGLTSITIPDGVEKIFDNAFALCTNLTSVTIPDSVIQIASTAFTSVPHIEYFGPYETDKAWGALSITGPGLYANGICYKELTRSDCSLDASLVKNYINQDNTTVILPKGITSIAKNSFSSCSQLSSIVLPESVESIGDFAFEKCTNLTSINFPEGLASIGENAFDRCTGLTSLSLPSTLSSFHDKAFIGCSGLESVSVAEGNTKYDSRNNCNAIMQKSTDYLLFGCKNTVIPSETKAINNYAFFGCTGLTSLTIPEGVQSIYNYAFAYCTDLTSLTIPNSVTYIMSLSFVDVPHIEYSGSYETDKPWGALSVN